VVTGSSNKTTGYAYNQVGMSSLTAYLTNGSVQTTGYVFGVTTGSGSGLNSNDIVGATQWPDPTTGAPSSSQQETTTVNGLGQRLTSTDRNGNVHTLSYDVLGRVVSDQVTTLGSGVDGSVRRIDTAYDGQGNAYLITSYSTTSGSTIVNQV
jgi:YD repeat-containing protein